MALRQGAAQGQFLQEFVFATGRRCRNFDELVQGCYAQWDEARAMLGDGTFAGFLSSLGRADLARLARDCQALSDRDMALTQFLDGLPASSSAVVPRLELHPRRLSIGPLRIGDQQAIAITLRNEGSGQLQGNIRVADGQEWLTLEQENIRTPREQMVRLHVHTGTLTVGQNYTGKLVVVTNGGAAELPVRLELQARPFALAPYQGATSPHDLARRMRDNPKPAVALITNGEIALWFVSNGWTYPIVGQPAPGLACVQQYFEELGLAKAPVIRISHERIEQTLQNGEMPLIPLVLASTGRKLVYARAETNVPWLKVEKPSVSGQMSATVEVRIDSSLMDADKQYSGAVKVIANANQTFLVPVRVKVARPKGWFGGNRTGVLAERSGLVAATAVGGQAQPLPGIPPAPIAPPLPEGDRRFGLAQAILMGAFLGFLWRLVLALPADLYARVLGNPVSMPLPGSLEAWLSPPAADEGFLRLFVLAIGWVGPLAGLASVWRRGGNVLDLFCGLVAGAVLGLVGAATLGCLLVLGDTLPRLLLGFVAAGATLSPAVATLLWLMLAIGSWIGIGAVSGGLLACLGTWGNTLLYLAAYPVATTLRLAGLENIAKFFEMKRS
jgi:hypothetical protein